MNKAISMLKKLFNTNTVMTPFISLKDRKPDFNSNITSVPLEIATPESQGIDSTVILKYLQELNNDSTLVTVVGIVNVSGSLDIAES